MRVSFGCPWPALSICFAAALLAAPSGELATGEGSFPSPPPEAPELVFRDGAANLQIAMGQTRAMRFRLAPPDGIALTCSGQQLEINRWYRFPESTACIVKAHSPRGRALQIDLLMAAAAEIEKLRPPGRIFSAVTLPDSLDSYPATIEVRLRAPQAGTSETSSEAGERVLDWLLAGLMAVALLGVGGFLLYKRRRRELGRELWKARLTTEPDKAAPAPQPRGQSITEERLEMLQAEFRESDRSLQEQIVRLRSECVTQSDLKTLRDEMNGWVQDFKVAVENAVIKSGQKQAAEVSDLRNLVASQSRTLEQLRDGASQHLVQLLRIIPETAFDDQNMTGSERQLIARSLEESLQSFFVQSVPARDGLDPLKARAMAIRAVVAKITEALGHRFPELAEKLEPCRRELDQIVGEMNELLKAAANRTLNLTFQVEFYASQANRTALTDSIAGALKEQIVKLERPLEHFERRLLALSAATSQTVSDYLDLNIDPQRNDGSAQELMNELLAASGLEQIAPAPGDAFRATEQTVVQIVPPPAASGLASSVARLVTRGFRRNTDVLRKASVILYE